MRHFKTPRYAPLPPSAIRRKSAPETAFVAAAYDPRNQIVTQCYAEKNTKPPARVAAFVNRIFLKTKPKLAS